MFKTTIQQQRKLIDICYKMSFELEEDFIDRAKRIAKIDQGVYDLMEMWFMSRDGIEKDDIMDLLTQSIMDYENGENMNRDEMNTIEETEAREKEISMKISSWEPKKHFENISISFVEGEESWLKHVFIDYATGTDFQRAVAIGMIVRHGYFSKEVCEYIRDLSKEDLDSLETSAFIQVYDLMETIDEGSSDSDVWTKLLREELECAATILDICGRFKFSYDLMNYDMRIRKYIESCWETPVWFRELQVLTYIDEWWAIDKFIDLSKVKSGKIGEGDIYQDADYYRDNY